MKHWIGYFLDRLHERFREKAAEPRLWIVDAYRTWAIKEVTCKPTVEEIIVHCGLKSSKSEARRAINAGAVKYRDGWNHDCWTSCVSGQNFSNPSYTVVRIGTSFIYFMVPHQTQSKRFWEKFFLDENIL